MATNNSEFIQSPFNKARSDKFIMVLNFPDSLKKVAAKFTRSNTGIIPNSLQFSVYGAVVPDINIPAQDLTYGGQPMTISTKSRPPWDPVTVNFTIDNRFNNYWVIYSWLNLLNDQRDGTQTNTSKNNAYNITKIEYRANISLFILDEYEKKIIEFLYKDAFPVSLGGINLSNRTSTEIETTFTFNYSQLIANLVENTDSL